MFEVYVMVSKEGTPNPSTVAPSASMAYGRLSHQTGLNGKKLDSLGYSTKKMLCLSEEELQAMLAPVVDLPPADGEPAGEPIQPEDFELKATGEGTAG